MYDLFYFFIILGKLAVSLFILIFFPAHFLPGVCLIIVGYLGCSFFWANVFLILALGFNGAASIANLSNNQDLSPNYAGFLYGNNY